MRDDHRVPCVGRGLLAMVALAVALCPTPGAAAHKHPTRKPAPRIRLAEPVVTDADGDDEDPGPAVATTAPPPPGGMAAPAPAPVQAPAGPHAGKGTHHLTFMTPKNRTVTLTWRKQARSIGSTYRGRLENGACLPPSGFGFTHFGPNSCGTDELVAIVQHGLLEVAKEFPGTARAVIGSLSAPNGGRIKPHKSHRSGRDVDIGFYVRNNRELSIFEELDPRDIDFEKTFFLMVSLVASGRVTNIFVNYQMQPYLYEAARAMGYDDPQLAWLFEYPRGRNSKLGIIRHARGHTRHFHVRFACPDGDACGD